MAMLPPHPARLAAVVLVAALGALSIPTAAPDVPPAPPLGDRSVQDLAGVLHPDVAARMEDRHRRVFEATGVAIVVVTVPRLRGVSIEELAVGVGQEWGVGRRREDRGVVIALSVGDREVFIASGYGVEGFLPDGRVGAILDGVVVPFLHRDDFSSGLDNASIAVARAAAEEYGIDLDGDRELRPPPGVEPGAGVRQLVGIGIGLILLWLLFRHPTLLLMLLLGGRGGGFSGGFGGGGGFGGFGGGGFGGGGAGRSF